MPVNLTRAQMEQIIQAGGSVMHSGRLYATIADLPSEADLAAGDEQRENMRLQGIDDQVAKLFDERRQIVSAQQERAAAKKAAAAPPPPPPVPHQPLPPTPPQPAAQAPPAASPEEDKDEPGIRQAGPRVQRRPAP